VFRLLPPNTYLADGALRSLLGAWLKPATLAWAEPHLVELGRAAAGELQEWGDDCERHPAFLRPVDPWGNRVDEVVYSDAWRRIAHVAARSGLVGLPYEEDARQHAGSEVRMVQAALGYLFQPSTATYFCPVAMTDGAARVLLEFGPDSLRRGVAPHLISRDPDQAWSAGQWMTERQGGSDVGSNAVLARAEQGGWRLYGQKFFCSNVSGEVVLALARPEGAVDGTRGLALFLVPRLLPDGTRNPYRIDRLKDKLGTRAMATAEVTLEGAHAELVGEQDRGFTQMTPMLNLTRLHNAISSAATMRRAVMLACGYAAQREAFGRRLARHPLHREVLLDMAVQAEAGLYLTMRVAGLLGKLENGKASEAERALFRVGVTLAKLYTARQAVAVASEAIECFGGQGYVEDTGIPRLLRDAQVLPIWEGTTSVLALDVLRVVRKPGVVEALASELERLGSPGRNRVMTLLSQLAVADAEVAQGAARRLAFALAEVWIEGLLCEAGQGKRGAVVAARWASRAAACPAPYVASELEIVVGESLA
jgi:alkylation response protein AidB-like acyl-CoA dehydrogenase